MQNKLKGKEIVQLVIICVLFLAVVAVVLVFAVNKKTTDTTAETQSTVSETDVVITEKEKERFIEIEKKITASTIQDGLTNMGFLVTQEYYFTEVLTNEKTESALWGLISSTATYTVKYDGSVYAGVNFSKIKVEKDETKVVVTVPVAEIQSVSIDYDSFEMLVNEDGLWAHMTPEDYNDSLVALEANARSKAVQKGVLIKAKENAEKMIRELVAGIINQGEEIVIKFQ